MTKRRGHQDAEDAQRSSEATDTAQGPGPVLDQDTPAPMPIFDENERAAIEADLDSAVDPQEFAELGPRPGEELDSAAPIAGVDEPGVAGRAQPVDPDTQEKIDRMA